MPISRKQQAIELRQQGYTYSDIAQMTGLSKSTLSYHLSGTAFVPSKETMKRLKLAQIRSAETKNRQKIASIKRAQVEAAELIKQVTTRDKLIAGIALYAGEGSKTLNLVRLVNTNPRIVRFFVDWLQLLGVPRTHVRARVHGYPDTDVASAERYWCRVLDISKAQLQPACIDKRSKKDSKRAYNQPHGTVHVTVKACGDKRFGAALARKIEALCDILLG